MDFKKRIFIVLCAVMLTVGVLAVPALAVEVGEEYIFTYDQTLSGFVNMDLMSFSIGDFLAFDLYASLSTGADFTFISSLSGEMVDASSLAGEGAIGFVSGNFRFGQAASPFGGSMSVLYVPNGGSGMSLKMVVTSVKNEPAVNAINSAFNTLIMWVGMIVSGVISGPMSGLLMVFAIGVAVTFVVLAYKLIRKFIWGA